MKHENENAFFEEVSRIDVEMESEWDSVVRIYIVKYTKEDLRYLKVMGRKLKEYLHSMYNSGGWTCNHAHDCCGCWAHFVLYIQFPAKGIAAIKVRSIKNV